MCSSPFTASRRLPSPRLSALLELALSGPLPRPVVDVGCDHGHLARALGAVGTERLPRRLPRRRDLPLVVADGLAPFRRVGTAVLAGMGAATIARILERGPRPRLALLHAPDRPARLRLWLAEHGWRIEAERLAPEAGRYAELIRAVPGREPHSGLLLAFGPRLLEDPLLLPHLRHELGRWRRLLEAWEGHRPERAPEARAWVDFLEGLLRERGG